MTLAVKNDYLIRTIAAIIVAVAELEWSCAVMIAALKFANGTNSGS